jgi:aspartate racemase
LPSTFNTPDYSKLQFTLLQACLISVIVLPMKIIGLIGGMSWESSAAYYRIINETTKARLGVLYSAKSLMYTVNFHEIEQMQHKGEWEKAGEVLVDAAQRLEHGGADCIVLCTNTMHKLASSIEAAVKIPFIHIADATAEQIKKQGIKKISLLGTGFTMEQDFYKGRLVEKFGLEVIIPEKADRDIVHRIIYNELCQGKIEASSKAEYVRIMAELVKQGAEGIILGCTEIMLLVGQADSPVPVFDTTTIHAVAAVDFALDVVD